MEQSLELKKISLAKLPLSDHPCQSSTLHPSPIPSHDDPRAFYLEGVRNGNLSLVPPPLISSSTFVPPQVIHLLMRRKKNSALGVKFMTARLRPDEITDMEGALHTFVTPVIARCEMVGDYRFDFSQGGHGISTFGDVGVEGGAGKVKLTRSVVMSASIQMDFENSRVMLKLCKLDWNEVAGRDLGKSWEPLSVEKKQDANIRKEYDESLRAHMVFHLVKDGRLPKRTSVGTMYMDGAIEYLESVIQSEGEVQDKMVGRYVETNDDQIVSLELLFNVAVEQVRNEISALEALCPQGYVYTYDPASIFAREIGSPILNRLMLAATKALSDKNQFKNMIVFAFNDYADKFIMGLVESALRNQPGVQVMEKARLFGGALSQYDVRHLKHAESAMLVVRNNSDGFGQNIETEGMFGSLDGAIGSSSSAAASLERTRADLLDFLC